MVKRKWLWGKRSSEKMGGENESSGSLSSQSEKYSEDQDASKGSQSNSQSPEVTSEETDNENNGEEMNESLKSLATKLSDTPIDDGSQDSLSQEDGPNVSVGECTQKLSDSFIDDQSADSLSKEIIAKVSVDKVYEPEKVTKSSNECKEDNDSVKLLTEKLSAALVNVSLKDDLVKQHAKVAEEAVAGWEKAENEVSTLKQQLETTTQQKSAVEARANHLDEALKECVRQLRLSRDEQERKINQAVSEKTNELELAKAKLEDQLIEFHALVETSRVSSPDPELLDRLKTLGRENVVLRKELQVQSDELEIRTIERDLSTKAAEMASKQHLESIKKIAKLEAECRKLKSISRVSSIAGVSSYADSLTDSHSDSGEQFTPSEAESRKINGSGNPSCSESWASALIAELDQFKTEKVGDRSMQCNPSPPIEIDLMDDFLEMERLAALPPMHDSGHRGVENPVTERESKLRVELEPDINRTVELEEKIEKVEAEKDELRTALVQTQSCFERSQVQLIETQMKLDQLEEELWGANEGQEFFKAKVISLEKEAQLMCSKIKSLREEVDEERALSVTSSVRCEELESELEKKKKELEVQQDAICNGELRMKEVALVETQECLEKLRGKLREAEIKLGELRWQLNASIEEKDSLGSQLDREQAMLVEKSARCEELEIELEKKKKELEIQQDAICNGELKMQEIALAEARECLEKSKGQLREAETTRGELERQLNASNEEKDSLRSQLDRERAIVVEKSARCEELENELEKKKTELEIQQDAICNSELKMKEIALAEARECLEKSKGQLRETEMKLGELQRELNASNEEKGAIKSQLDMERALSVANSSRCEELENELERRKNELEIQKDAICNGELKMKEMELTETREGLEKSKGKLREVEMKLGEIETELNAANVEKRSLRSQLDSVRTEVQAMSCQINSLKEQVCKERALAAEFSTKCVELENALQQKANAHNELKIKQEDLESAAGKLADCQKTIASLGTQLKSLATLEDFLIDTASIPGFSPPAPLMARRSTEPWKLHSNHTFLPEKEYGPHEGHGPFMRGNHNGRHTRESHPQASSSSSSTSSAYFMNPPGCEKSANGFAKYFSLSRN